MNMERLGNSTVNSWKAGWLDRNSILGNVCHSTNTIGMSTDNKRNREICKNMNVEVNVCFSNPIIFEFSKRELFFFLVQKPNIKKILCMHCYQNNNE